MEMVSENQLPDRYAVLEQNDALFALAACGDADAAAKIIATINAEAANGYIGDHETFALAENVAAIGVGAGDPQMAATLALVLLLRRRFEQENGRSVGLDYLARKALDLLVELTVIGHVGAEADLRAAVDALDETTVLAAAKEHPSLLALMIAKGTS